MVHDKGHSANILTNIRWGLGWTLGFTIAYSLIATAVFVVAGPPPDYSFGHLLATYLILGVIAGVALGVLRPIGKTKLGAVFLGMIVGTLVYLGSGMSVYGPRMLRDPGGVIGLLLAGVVVGGLMGRKSWLSSRDEANRWK
jgi:hypothetical protein